LREILEIDAKPRRSAGRFAPVDAFFALTAASEDPDRK
jgi:hypothetical protein